MFKHQIFSYPTAVTRQICTYVVSVLVLGTIGSLIFWYRHKRGTVVIHGLDRYHKELATGRVIIACNHPTILESMFLLFMCWPRCLWQPRKFFPWSMPDKELFYQMGMPSLAARLLYWTSNSIPVERSGDSSNAESYSEALKVLLKGGSLIVHPEAGRTSTPLPDNTRPRYIKTDYDSRCVRNFTNLSKIPKLAKETNARILPVYVDIPFWKTHNTFTRAWKEWSKGNNVISIHIGKPYRPDPIQSPVTDNEELAKRILAA